MQKNVSNRWYASALRARKSQNGSGFNKFFGDCAKESENQPNGFVESHRKSQPSPFQKVKNASRLDNLVLSTEL